MTIRTTKTSTRRPASLLLSSPALLLSLLAARGLPAVMAQECISLAGSTACPAFASASVSTVGQVRDLFTFLDFVSDTQSFDDELRRYIATSYSQVKYKQLIGCSSVNLTNTVGIYARYTTSFLCNAIVQNSIGPCNLSADQAPPLCADTCAEYAISEQRIAATPELCGTPGDNALPQIRSDYINCGLPDRSLDNRICIPGYKNEPENCGYQENLAGLCGYCAESSPNSTDSCCLTAEAETRCDGVRLPFTTSMAPLWPSSTAPGSQPTNGTAADTDSGLSGGAIAGIVVGAIAGAALLLLLVIGFLILRRRRRATSHSNSSLNQPTPSRHGPPGPAMSFTGSGGGGAEPPTIIPGGRVARLTALESSSSSSHHGPISTYNRGSLEAYDSPESHRHYGGIPPKRTGSLSSRDGSSPDSRGPVRGATPRGTNGGNADFSSPEGMGSGQSEQLQSFKDYYSQEDIRPGDAVATLWAYAPRANDEFELDRGDMLKVVGIWDDGWATGVKLHERAEDWDDRRRENRDSGVSNGSGLQERRDEEGSPSAADGEIKAFPLVCVCLPQHWRKTIDSDAADPGMSGHFAGSP